MDFLSYLKIITKNTIDNFETHPLECNSQQEQKIEAKITKTR